MSALRDQRVAADRPLLAAVGWGRLRFRGVATPRLGARGPEGGEVASDVVAGGGSAASSARMGEVACLARP